MDTENYAVGYLKEYLSLCNYLKASINSEDKIPFTDGKILLYKEKDSNKKSEYNGCIDIQVKGHQVDDASGKVDNRKYSIDIDDLNAYKLNGGCIYFVVDCDIKGNGQAYFVALTPMSIEAIKKSSNAQTSISVLMNPLPSDHNVFTNIIYSAYADCEYERKKNNEIKITNIGEHIKNGYNVLTYTGPATDCNFDEFIFGFKHHIYLVKDDDIIRVAGDNTIECISKEMPFSVYIGETKYYDSYTVSKTSNNTTIELGHATKIDISYLGQKNTTVNISLNDYNYDVYELYQDLGFVINLVQNEPLKFVDKNGKEVAVFSGYRNETNINIDGLIKKYEFLDEVIKTLEILRINNDEKLLVKDLSSKDNYWLDLLTKNVLYNIQIPEKVVGEYNPLVYMDLNNIRLLLYFEKVDGGYNVYNPDVKRFKVELRFDDETLNKPVTQYYNFTADDFSKISNLDFENIYDTNVEIGNVDDINDCAIKLLTAYDLTKKGKYIDISERLFDWALQNVADDKMHHCLKMNKMQIQIRKNIPLNTYDLDYLNNVLYNDTFEVFLKIGASLLLGNFSKTDELMNQLSDEERENYKKMPIFKLYKV